MTNSFPVIGQKYIPKAGCEGECGNFRREGGEYIIFEGGSHNGTPRYEIYKNGKKVGWCSMCFNEGNLVPMEESIFDGPIGGWASDHTVKGKPGTTWYGGDIVPTSVADDLSVKIPSPYFPLLSQFSHVVHK